MKRSVLFLLAGVLALGLGGCAKAYRVDYGGQKMWYKGARDSYRAGQTVRLEYGPVATDTDYHFTVNVDAYTCRYEAQIDGYVLEFVMPEQDVIVACTSENAMESGGNG